jgi:putative membrane protein
MLPPAATSELDEGRREWSPCYNVAIVNFSPVGEGMRLLLNWLLSALALLVVAKVVPGFYVRGLGTALLAALVVGLVNATLGLFLKVVTLPLTVLTLGIFWFVINALMLWLASALVPGFEVRGFLAAFLGAIVLALVNMVLRWLVPKRGER